MVANDLHIEARLVAYILSVNIELPLRLTKYCKQVKNLASSLIVKMTVHFNYTLIISDYNTLIHLYSLIIYLIQIMISILKHEIN